MPPIRVIVGTESEDTIPRRRYISDRNIQLSIIRDAISDGTDVFFCSCQQEVVGFMTLHGLGEYEVTLVRSCGDTVKEFDLDKDGMLICPWPDEFFEICFYLMFMERS